MQNAYSSFSMLKRGFFRSSATALFLATVLLYGQISRAESGLVVAVRKDSQITQLSREEVVDLFLGKRKHINGSFYMAIDSKDNALRDRFYQAAADMNAVRVKAYWSRIVFSGQGRPPQEASTAEAIARLTDDPSALIYLPADLVTPEMKIVFSIP